MQLEASSMPPDCFGEFGSPVETLRMEVAFVEPEPEPNGTCLNKDDQNVQPHNHLRQNVMQ